MESHSERLAARKGRVETGHFIEPMACLAVVDLPTGSDWEYELKLDGYRAIAFKTRGRVHLRSRNGKDFSQRFWSLIRPFQRVADETLSTAR
jgi:ATP-dependent DNA ligase